jgi:hypothetical protein
MSGVFERARARSSQEEDTAERREDAEEPVPAVRPPSTPGYVPGSPMRVRLSDSQEGMALDTETREQTEQWRAGTGTGGAATEFPDEEEGVRVLCLICAGGRR